MFSARAWLAAIVDAWFGHYGPPTSCLPTNKTIEIAGVEANSRRMEYKGFIQKIGTPRLHEASVQVLEPLLTPNTRVLDCGAGSGAFALRLKDMGYYVEAVELDKDFFRPKHINCYNANLNDNFSGSVKNKFDVITAIEVIEHLENPRHFLRECHKLLNPHGRVLITTPNVECIPGRLKFLLKGNLRGFEFDLYKDSKRHEAEHVTPIFSSLFMRVAKDTGFNVVKHVVYPKNTFPNSRGVFVLTSKVIAPFLGGSKYGETHIFLLEKG
jgi:2-polyprenyl-3-methyl-5-hydroxy-6-metoxy-1,4-benzoquinol methylase